MNTFFSNQQDNDKYPKVEIKPIRDLLSCNLCIPDYQRPYKWKAHKHVSQLIEDVIRESGRIVNEKHVEYRIGTIILYKNENQNNSLDIVDGQQRLITLTLILEVLNSKSETNQNDNFKTIVSHKFEHDTSKKNIKYNFEFIKKYFDAVSIEESENVRDYLLQYCSFVVIELKEVSEAFQLFDSQNARGKHLDPADLLKAFHLREMYENTYEEKKQCVKNWENAIDHGLLNEVINKYLFRIRNWNQKNWEYYFTKDNIDHFKGINIFKSIQNGKMYPFIYRTFQNSLSPVFQIDEPIINGKRFFQYIENYVKIYKGIIDFTDNYVVKNIEPYDVYIFKYPSSGRIGDRRIRTLYQIMLMCYIDKFGHEDIDFKNFAKELYRWAYQERLTNQMIRYETILNIIKNNETPMNIIESWHEPDIVQFRTQLKRINDINIKKDSEGEISIKNGNLIKKIIEKFEEQQSNKLSSNS